MQVIALHGDYGWAEMLRIDMGDPHWVTEYYDADKWSRSSYELHFSRLVDLVASANRCVLVGYSRGGEVIANLALHCADCIAGAVLYESPVHPQIDAVPGDFPVMLIWNDKGYLRGRGDAAIESMQKWSVNHECKILIGQGRHLKSCPTLGHDWDQSLNDKIGAFIESLH